MNQYISFDQSPVQLLMESRFVVVADPAAMESIAALADTLPQSPNLRLEQIVDAFAKKTVFFSVCVHEIDAFVPGIYELQPTDWEVCDDLGQGRCASVDTGALVIFDYAKVRDVCRHFTWETYDLALQVAGNERFDAIRDAIGSSCFALMHGDADAEGGFQGDGIYRIRRGAPKKMG